MTLPRFELTISFPSWHVKNRDYFAFLHKSSGHRDTIHKTGTNPGKPGRMVTLLYNSFLKADENGSFVWWCFSIRSHHHRFDHWMHGYDIWINLWSCYSCKNCWRSWCDNVVSWPNVEMLLPAASDVSSIFSWWWWLLCCFSGEFSLFHLLSIMCNLIFNVFSRICYRLVLSVVNVWTSCVLNTALEYFWDFRNEDIF